MLGYPGVLGLYGLQAAAAAALLAGSLPAQPFLAPLPVLAATLLAINYRNGFGGDGSDQMNLVIVLPLALAVLTPGSLVVLHAALAFVALQACLAYVASGVAKAVSPVWRSGEAVFAVMNTASYGARPLAAFLRRRPRLCFALSWSVILMESLFPLCLVLDPPWFWAFLLWGTGFHLYCAVVMGLNSFFWAFVATYPVLLWARGMLVAGG